MQKTSVKERKDNINIKKIFFYTCFMLLPFWLTFENIEKDGKEFLEPAINISSHIEIEKTVLIVLGILAFLYIVDRIPNLIERSSRTFSASLAIYFALCIHTGKSFSSIGSWDYYFASPYCFVTSLAIVTGYAIFLYYLLCSVIYFVNNYNEIFSKYNSINKFGKKIDKFLSEKTFIKLWLGIFICWLPYIIINYPATFHADSGRMLVHYMNGHMDNHDPIVQQLFLGSFVTTLYDITGSYNIPSFLFSFLQSIYCSLIFAAFYKYVYKKGCPSVILFVFYVITALLPMYTRNSATICKDSNYSIYVLLFTLIIIMFNDSERKQYTKLIPMLLISMLLTMFARKNGIHLIVITSLAFLIYLFFMKKKEKFVIVFIATVASSICYISVEKALIAHYELSDNDTRESSSIFFQQTARYIRDYKNEVTKEERDAINAILDYNVLAEKYNPRLSDPVKATFRNESTPDDYKRYLSVWLSQFNKHPDCYIQATIHNTYGYFYPDDFGYYSDLYFESKPLSDIIQISDEAKEFAEFFRVKDCRSRYIPVIGLFSSVGFYIWVDIFVLFFALYKKRYEIFIYNMPCVTTLIVCIASPVNNTVRYALPIIFLLPFIICAYFTKKEVEPPQR